MTSPFGDLGPGIDHLRDAAAMIIAGLDGDEAAMSLILDNGDPRGIAVALASYGGVITGAVYGPAARAVMAAGLRGVAAAEAQAGQDGQP